MPQIREQIAMVHLPPSKTLKYLFHVRKTRRRGLHIVRDDFFIKKSSLTRFVAPPLRKKARGSRLSACKRAHDRYHLFAGYEG